MDRAPRCRGAAGSAVALLALIATAQAGAAEYDAGRFVVHYSVVATMDLAPEVADAYSIARSPSRALLNVSVVAKVPHALGKPIPALVQVSAVDDAGQFRPIAMRRVDEPPSVYYLGEFTVDDHETLNFELSVLAEGELTPVRLRLQQQFFTR
jgi:hypothetical protein